MKKLEKYSGVKICVTMSTRPRMTFDEKGYCSACQWFEEKRKLTGPKEKNVKRVA